VGKADTKRFPKSDISSFIPVIVVSQILWFTQLQSSSFLPCVHSFMPSVRALNIISQQYQLGRIVLVAQEDIPPLTELTFDYCPGNLPPFTPKCLCGSKLCRNGPYRQKKKNSADVPDGAYDPSDEYSDTDNEH